MTRTYGTTEILRTLSVPFWRLEYLIRAGRIMPINRGRGRERRFTEAEFQKIKQFLVDELEHDDEGGM